MDFLKTTINKIIIENKINKIKNKIIIYSKSNKIRRLASSIVTKRKNNEWAIKERDYIGEIKAIYDWVQKNIRYTHDPYGHDIIETPFKTIKLRIADCDAKTILIGSLLRSIGYPIKLKLIRQKGYRGYHIYPLVGVPPEKPTKWIAVDASFNRGIGFEPPYIERRIIKT